LPIQSSPARPLRFEKLEVRAIPGHLIGDHIHPQLRILLEGEEVTIPANIGLELTRHYSPHTHDTAGTLHLGESPVAGIDPPTAQPRLTTLKDFFDVWRTTNSGTPANNPNAFFSQNQILDRIADATHVVRMAVNGQPNFEFENYSPHDQDQILISFEELESPPNQRPTANGQSVSTSLSTPVSVSLSGDDGDVNLSQALSFRVQTLPTNGVLRGSGGNLVAVGTSLQSPTVTYTPNAGFAGNDSFTFAAVDDGGTANGGQDTSEPATVAIAVAANQKPIANPQSVSVAQGFPQSITLTGDDGDAGAVQTLVFQVRTPPSNGQLRDSNNNPVTTGSSLPNASVNYVPNAGFNGTDNFTFTVKDDGGTTAGGQDTSAPATVSLNVFSNNTPTAISRPIGVRQNGSRTFPLQGDDGDADLVQALTFRVQSLPANGTLKDSNGTVVSVGSPLATANVTYTPNPGYLGADSFTFDVKDDGGGPDTSTPATISLNVVNSIDPNDIQGPLGDGEQHALATNEPLPFTVRFENYSNATAPAQQVIVKMALDEDWNWESFRFTEIGFGETRIALPTGEASFQTELDMTATDGTNLRMQVSGRFDSADGSATWNLRSVDPATGDLPEDPFVGFLPPNDSSHRGEGFVRYVVQPRTDRAVGTRLDCSASIVFDANSRMDTNKLFHTIGS
jgi:hypothetical protein